MIKEDIPLYKLDLEGNSKFNKVEREYRSRQTVKNNHIFIPRHAPFYQDSVKVYGKDGQPLTPGEDYEFYGIMGKLTQFTGKAVGLFIRLLKDEITEWRVDYQVVGNFNKLTNETLNMLHSIFEDDRFVHWDNIENKPLWFVPELHRHDLAYDIFGFTDLVKELKRVTDIMKVQKSPFDIQIEAFQNNIEVYIEGFKKVLFDLIDSHDVNKKDAHGVDKKAIGLDKVDNIATATLQETIEGVRDDLRITPYNAAQAAALAAGRNDRLFPSGALPLLRYGSDTFIPPTIQGSFEGLGGTSSRCGAIVEDNDSLLILRHRNNGKISGLYFTRCDNWRSSKPEYEFTAYQYTHPTATAAGATLDTIIDGSNRYVMVVGDAKKGLWWWCETKGTFDPDRHVLIPLSGPWVTEDCNPADYNVADIYNRISNCSICADQNYSTEWFILQSYMLPYFNDKRRKFIPGWDTLREKAWGGGAFVTGAYSINVVNGKSGNIRRARVNYKHYHYPNFNDGYFTPYPPVVVNNGGEGVIGGLCRFTEPAQTVQTFRSPQTYFKKMANGPGYGLRVDMHFRIFGQGGVNVESVDSNYKCKIQLRYSGSEVIADIQDAEGFGLTSAIINPNNPQATPEEYAKYQKYTYNQLRLTSQDQTGVAQLTGEYAMALSGTGNVAFPPIYTVYQANYLVNGEELIKPAPDLSQISQYTRKGVPEQNPIGMGTMFQCQRYVPGDLGDPSMSGLMARQAIYLADGTSRGQWFYRPADYMDANWNHKAPGMTSTFQGKQFKHYPFVSSGGPVTGLGHQLVVAQQRPYPGKPGQECIRKMFATATCSSRMMGRVPEGQTTPTNVPSGDGKMVWDYNATWNGSAPNFAEKVVVDISNALPAVAGWLAPLGYTLDDVKKTYIVGMAQSPNGQWHGVWQVYRIVGSDLYVACIVTAMSPGGTKTTVDGVDNYSSVNISKLSEPVNRLDKNNAMYGRISYRDYYTGGTSYPGTFISIPYSRYDGTNIDASTYFVMIGSDARYQSPGGDTMISSCLEITPDGKTITQNVSLWMPEWGIDSTYVPVPYYGFGSARGNTGIFEGAAVGSDVPIGGRSLIQEYVGSIYQAAGVVGMSNILTPLYTVYFQEKKNVLLGGKMYDIPATYIDIRDQDPNPANKTYYVYLVFNGSGAGYTISQSVIPESATNAMIAVVYCGGTQIDRITPFNKFVMDGAHVIATRRGSAILASSGSSFDIGDTSTILKESDFIP